MKLLLRRDQKAGMLGKVIFTLSVRAQLSEDEKSDIKKYKLGNALLYRRDKLSVQGDSVMSGISALMADKIFNLTLTIDDLEKGKLVECKDIVEMLSAEDGIREAAHNFHAILRAASTFGGEEVLEIA